MSNQSAAKSDQTGAASGGSDVAGAPAKPWRLAEWASSKPHELSDYHGQVVVVRFWTNDCPYCAKSMPALEQLAEEFRGRPVRFLGIYHSKPLGSDRPWNVAVAMAREWGITFPIAYDRGWQTVKSWWLETGSRSATSASFIIDGTGTIVHVHPGPMFFPSDDPADTQYDRDFRQLRQAIVDALARLNGPGTGTAAASP